MWTGCAARAVRISDFSLFFFGSRLLPGIRAWSPARRATEWRPERAVTVRRRRSLTGIDSRDGARGLRRPFPPTPPNPALGQPPVMVGQAAQGVPFPPLCRAAEGVRSAVFTSVKRLSRLYRMFRGQLSRIALFSVGWRLLPGIRAWSPARRATEWRPERAVTVRRRRSLTGIDSRDAAGDKGLAQPLAPYDPPTPRRGSHP